MQKQHFSSPHTGLLQSRLQAGSAEAEPFCEPTPELLPELLPGFWQRLWSEEEGQTLVEYGLLIGLIALVIVAAVTIFGRRMNENLYGTSNNGLPLGT